MRIKRGERTAGVENLKLRKYLRRFGDQHIDCASLAEEFSISRRKAEKLIGDLVKLELICRSDTQYDKTVVNYETTIQGNAFGMAKAGKPVFRKSVDSVLREFLERVKAVNEREDLAHRIESVVVFGSYLTGASRLNDLDLSVELIGKWTDDATYHAACKGSMERARASGRRFRNVVEEVCWPRTEVLLLLKNRSERSACVSGIRFRACRSCDIAFCSATRRALPLCSRTAGLSIWLRCCMPTDRDSSVAPCFGDPVGSLTPSPRTTNPTGNHGERR